MAKIYGDTITTPIKPGTTSGGGTYIDVDQTYKPNSQNAQSGKAVAEAINKTLAQNFIVQFITWEDDD